MDAIVKSKWLDKLPKLPNSANWVAHTIGICLGIVAIQTPLLDHYRPGSLLLSFCAMIIAIVMAVLTGSFLTMPVSPVPPYLLYIIARASAVVISAFMLWAHFFELHNGSSGL